MVKALSDLSLNLSDLCVLVVNILLGDLLRFPKKGGQVDVEPVFD